MIGNTSIKMQRRVKKLAEYAIYIAWCFSMPLLWFRLASMRLDGLPTIAITSLAIGIGYTSLLYGRARALEDGAWRRRSLVAAEKALRGVMFHIVCLIFGMLIFSQLITQGYTPKIPNWSSHNLTADLDFVPIVFSILPLFFLQIALQFYFFSVQTLVHRGFLSAGYENISSRHKGYYLAQEKRLLANQNNTNA